MVEKGSAVSRREAMKLALKGGAYAAPVVLASAIPFGVAAATPAPGTADLQVTFTLTSATPAVGSLETIRVTVTNLGPSNATNVVLNGNLFIFGFATPTFAVSQGTLDPVTGAWTNPLLAVGASATLTVTGTVTAAGARTATAGITHSDQPDPNAANNNVSITITGTPAPSADLQVTFTLTSATPTVGSIENIRVTVTNLGPSNATNVVLNGNLFIFGFASPSFAVSQGTLDPVTGAWTNPLLATGASASLSVAGTVTAVGPRTATAGIVSSDQPDPNAANNNVSITITGLP
jgi:hypothetical protein